MRLDECLAKLGPSTGTLLVIRVKAIIVQCLDNELLVLCAQEQSLFRGVRKEEERCDAEKHSEKTLLEARSPFVHVR